MNLVERIFALRELEPFRHLYDSEAAAIAEITAVRVLAPGEVAQRRGRPVRNLVAVARGGLVDGTGRELPRIWGERCIFTGREADLDVRAHPERGATCLLIPRPHALTIVHESPVVLLALIDAGTAPLHAAGEGP